MTIGQMSRLFGLASFGVMGLALVGDTAYAPVHTIVYLGGEDAATDASLGKFNRALGRASPKPSLPVNVAYVADLGAALGPHLTAIAQSIKPPSRLAVVAPSALAASQAQLATVPIGVVYASYFDPVQIGLARSHLAPGHGRTGVTLTDLRDGKRIELLHDAMPGLRQLAVLADPAWATLNDAQPRIQATCDRLGITVVFHLIAPDDKRALDNVLTRPAATAQGWYIPRTAVSDLHEEVIRNHLRRLGAYAMFTTREEVERGGLMALVQDTSFVYDALASLTLRVLDGEDPGTIPIERPKRYLLVVRTGKSSARTPIAPAVLRRADVVISD